MSSRFDKIFWLAVATLVGSTVGVGVYGIPFAFQKAGFLVGFLFLVGLGGLMLLANLLFGEIVLRTEGRHQLIGYTDKYLGAIPAKINLFTVMLGSYGALIGIIVISGGFLVNIFAFWFRLSSASWSSILIVVAAFFIFRGLRTISKIDFLVMIIFGIAVLAIGFYGFRTIDSGNFTLAVKDFWFLPFGVILFALNGISGIPLAKEVLSGHENKFRDSIIIGTLIPIIFYFIFSFIVVGITGESTSPDAISGLSLPFGHWLIFLGSCLGFLTSATILLNLGASLKESFQQDFNFKHRWAWLLTILPPYLLYLSGIRNFVDIINLVGGVAVGVEMIILIFIYVNARKYGERMPEYSIRLPLPVLYLMMLIFAVGAVYTVIIR
ncbi:MAG: aromatic amino acid transport family protein [Patescibacteria group bacterium]